MTYYITKSNVHVRNINEVSNRSEWGANIVKTYSVQERVMSLTSSQPDFFVIPIDHLQGELLKFR